MEFLITKMSGDESYPMEFDGFSDDHSMEADASANVSTHPSYNTQEICSGRDSRSSSGEVSSPESTSPRAKVSSPRMPLLEMQAPIVTSTRRKSASDQSRDRSSGSQRGVPLLANVNVLVDTPLNPPRICTPTLVLRMGTF